MVEDLLIAIAIWKIQRFLERGLVDGRLAIWNT